MAIEGKVGVLQEANKQIAEMMASYSKATEVALRALEQYRNIHSEFQAQFRRACFISERIRDKLFKISRAIPEWEKDLIETNLRYSKILLETGWPPQVDLFLEEIKRIISAYDKHDPKIFKRELNAFMMKKFDEKALKRMLAQWESKRWLKKRMPILKQAVKAHLNSDYYVSIPTLLSQIEGIIADGYGHCGVMDGKALKKYLRTLLSSSDVLSLDPSVQAFVIQNVLARFEHGSKPKSFLSRHAILHGGDTVYGSGVNSLKCILLFHYLQEKFSVASLKRGKTYHLLGCPILNRDRIRHKGKNWILHKMVSEATSEGKRPCKLCNP